jgi:hypothetical protein
VTLAALPLKVIGGSAVAGLAVGGVLRRVIKGCPAPGTRPVALAALPAPVVGGSVMACLAVGRILGRVVEVRSTPRIGAVALAALTTPVAGGLILAVTRHAVGSIHRRMVESGGPPTLGAMA